MSDESKLRKVGAMWKPKDGAKSKGSGAVTINGMRQGFVVLPNKYREPGSRQPDFILMSSDPPEPDEYAQDAPAPAAPQPIDDDVFPF